MRTRRRLIPLAVLMTAGALLIPSAPLMVRAASAATTADPVVAAAGDIACPPGASRTATKCHQGDTANQLVNGAFSAVLALGDQQYPCGTLSNYKAVYDKTWGQVKSTTFPIPGDNDYASNNGACVSPGAVGYFNYFADRFSTMTASPSQSCPNGGCGAWYSTNVGSWHVVALNSECTQTGVGGCTSTSPQYKWLVNDLAANPSLCTVAIMHKPYWANGTNLRKTKALVQALYNAHVELLLSGHSHLYIRYAPQDPSSNAVSTGIRQFVVGTGGVNHASLKTNLPNTQFKDNTHFGILKLTLHPTSYDFAFVADTGATIDSGSAACH